MSPDPADGAREGMAFSNSTDAYCWIPNWCDRCIHDKPAREGRYEDACGIFTLSLTGFIPVEWLEQPWENGHPPADRYHCIAFRNEDDGPPPPTEPEPTPPGQGELFPVDDYVRTRMFADVVREANVVPTC